MGLFLVVSLAIGVVQPQVASAAPYDLTEYPIPSPGIGAAVIEAGPDGNLWFTILLGNKVGKIEPGTGTITEYTIPSPGSFPTGIKAGPDGNMWFVAAGSNIVAKIEPGSGTITEYPIPTASDMGAIWSGPDGNMWFTQFSANQIAKVDPGTGSITEYPIPTPNSGPAAIISGPDGNMWFTQRQAHSIAKIDPNTGVITEYPVPTPASDPTSLTVVGNDIWFAQTAGNRLAKIDPNTGVITEYPTLAPGSSPLGVHYGPDGHLWATMNGSNEIARFDLSGNLVDSYSIPTANSSPYGITSGPDGNIWFTQFQGDGNNIGMLELPEPVVDVNITKELVNTGTVQVGDTVEYRITVVNDGVVPADDQSTALYDFFPGNLTYESSDSDSHQCVDYETVDPDMLQFFIQQTTPNHPDVGVVLCVAEDDLSPGESYSAILRFTVDSLPSDGFTNYVMAPDENEQGGDPDLAEFYSFFNSLSESGGDLIDAFESGPLVGNRNMASATYTPAVNERTNSELAASGTPVLPALGVVLSTIVPALIVTRRRVNYSGR